MKAPIKPATARNIAIVVITCLSTYLTYNIVTKGIDSVPSDVWMIYASDIILTVAILYLAYRRIKSTI